MKNVILSADSENILYSVPDEVAENLDKYCLEFCNTWLRESPDAEKYRIGGGVCYTEADFVDYLNTYIFPDKKSEMVRTLGWSIPEEYRKLPFFNF
ncbi:MAG: hypothetical protein IJM57_01170 [Lachnospiraceae bacterium]|nr:hypothetical protein [Lachnospiraceae bacterium]